MPMDQVRFLKAKTRARKPLRSYRGIELGFDEVYLVSFTIRGEG